MMKLRPRLGNWIFYSCFRCVEGQGHGSTTGTLQEDGLFACFCKPQIVLKLFHRSSAHHVSSHRQSQPLRVSLLCSFLFQDPSLTISPRLQPRLVNPSIARSIPAAFFLSVFICLHLLTVSPFCFPTLGRLRFPVLVLACVHRSQRLARASLAAVCV